MDISTELELATMLLDTEQYYEVEHFDSLRQALDIGLDDEKVVWLMDWKAAA